MSTTADRTPSFRVRVDVNWSVKIRQPTFGSLPILQGLWVVAALLAPQQFAALAAGACVPVAWLMASIARRKGVLRAPTATTFMASNVSPQLVMLLGFPVSLGLDPATAHLRMIIALVLCVALTIQTWLAKRWPA